MTDPPPQTLSAIMDQTGKPGREAITALFFGPSGSGRTKAAGAIANKLGVDLLQIDLSNIVSKYIGETEKNLDRVFEEAMSRGAVLVLDEADALMGKRSNVVDSHDRYANIDINYLLEKMEAHDWPVILTTKRKEEIDEAFLRRLRFVIEFPKPANAKSGLDDLKQQLRTYLTAHPNACDTQDAITALWLNEPQMGSAALARALVELEAEGVMSRSERDGKEVWHGRGATLDLPNRKSE